MAHVYIKIAESGSGDKGFNIVHSINLPFVLWHMTENLLCKNKAIPNWNLFTFGKAVCAGAFFLFF